MGNFDLANYAEVKDRISNFITDFEDGSIQTFLRFRDGPEVIFEARVFRTKADVVHGVYTSGFSREVEGPKGVNKTSHLENCETSAIGRALANLGYAADAQRASRSEMLKVARMTKEHDEMLAYIKDSYAKLSEETETVIDGETVKVKEFIKGNGGKLPEDFRLARSVTLALETVTGIPFTSVQEQE